MKINPEAHNSISIILDNGETFEIRDVQDSQGYHFEIHADKPFRISTLDTKNASWACQLINKWVRVS